jgi:hypothetical protein
MYGAHLDFGYQPFGTTRALLDSNNGYAMEAGENMAGAYGQQVQRENHERGLQNAEQSRRGYDSETGRMLGMKKMSVLNGLMGGRQTFNPQSHQFE